MYKALGNFRCNKVNKKIGEMLSPSDLDLISGSLDLLVKSKLVEKISGEVVEGSKTVDESPVILPDSQPEFEAEEETEAEAIEETQVKLSPKKTKKKNKGA